MGGATAGLLGIIASAVTPVVLISAAAALILGINQKHASLADRVRLLAVEYRNPATTDPRRTVIRAQAALFDCRLRHVAFAHLWLYASAVLFISTVLVIAARDYLRPWEGTAFALFTGGIVLMLAAIAAELLDLRMSRATIALEVRDILGDPPSCSTQR